MLKKVLIGLVGLVLILILIGFALPSVVELSRSTTINAPAAYVFEEINNLENNPKWSYWDSIFPDMSVTYGDIKSGVGAQSSWEGEDSGKGTMIITESIPEQSIKIDLDFMDQGTAKAWYTFEPEGEGTKLTTGFSTDFGMNLIGRWMGAVLMKGEMEKALDYKLAKLKKIAEAKPKFTVQLSEETTTLINYVGIPSSMSFADMNALSAQMAKSYGELSTVLGKAKVEITGPAFCIINKWDEGTQQTDFICAFPVAANAKVPAKYKVMQTEGSLAVKAIHNGSYDKLGEAHEQIGKYLEMKNLEMNGPVLEVYITDPEAEKDTAKWITEIYYPIKRQ
jgi:effector-binding domain-containing protein